MEAKTDMAIDEYKIPVTGTPGENAEIITHDNQVADAASDNASRPSTLISLGKYHDDDIITKKELCEAFKCGPRSAQRMVERFDIPPPTWLGGKKIWIVGNLRAWIVDAVKRNEAEAMRVARKMRVFDD